MAETKAHLLGDIQTILLLTDGSDYSAGAEKEALFFSKACNAALVALHVIEITSEMASMTYSGVAIQRKEISDHLEELKKQAVAEGIACETLIVESFQTDQTIIKEAKRHKADVIIMGRHGKWGLRKMMVGSMAVKVIQQGYPKVLVVPRKSDLMGRNILIATDGSDSSQRAAIEAIDFARRCATVEKITVISIASGEAKLLEAEANVSKVIDAADQAGVADKCEPLVVVGNPGKEVIDVAARRNIDLILIGGFGESGVTKAILGHVTEHVIRQVDCGVMVVTSSS